MKQTIGIILIIIILALLHSCNSSKKVAKFNEAVDKYVREHPTKKDTVTKTETLPGVKIPVVYFLDTVIRNRISDSLTEVLAKQFNLDVKVCEQQIRQAFTNGMDYQRQITPKTVECPPNTHTTNTITNTDVEDKLRKELYHQEGVNNQLILDIASAKKWMWWFFGLLGFNLVFFILKFKK